MVATTHTHTETEVVCLRIAHHSVHVLHSCYYNYVLLYTLTSIPVHAPWEYTCTPAGYGALYMHTLYYLRVVL